ncbi:MAG TPA: hypothetical protein VK098_06600 [Beutenbergiaceae bacterium]|nr:hypothetical protein [Beutenbergiaceae bacterium]
MFNTLRSWFERRTAGDLERGDVPGWVMIVIMTAGLVILIWALAGEALTRVFDTAINRILGA